MKLLYSLLILTTLGCCPDEDVIPVLNDADKSFSLQSSTDNVGIIALSALAIQKTNSPVITDLANDMNAVHQSATETLRIIAMDLGTPLENSMNMECNSLHAELQTQTASAFDSIYVYRLQELQSKRSLLFLSQLEHGLNQRLKNYAQLHAMHATLHAARIDSIVETYR